MGARPNFTKLAPLADGRSEPRPIVRWDGRTAERILEVLLGEASYQAP